MKNILAIAIKDLRSTARDRTTLFWLTLGPMAIVALISAAYSGFAGGRNVAAQAVPGFSLMFMLFGVAGIGDSFFEERERGTWQRLLTSSVTKFELLGGKFMAGYTIAIGQLLLLFSMGYFVFKIPFGVTFGGRIAVLLVLLASSLAALSLGLLVTALFTNRKQFGAFFTVLILVMCQIGGAWLPLFLMPEWLQKLSQFTFIAHAMEAFNLTHFGLGLRAALPNIVALVIYAAVCLALGYYLIETTEVNRARRRRKVCLSLAIFFALVYAGSRVNAISYPAFVKNGKNGRSAEQSNAVPTQSPSTRAESQDAENHYRAAEQSWEKKDVDSALASLEKAIALDPSSAKYLGKYGDLTIASGAFARGASFLRTRIERGETAALHFQVGRIEVERFRRDPNVAEKQQASMRAIEHLSRAIELDPKHAEARFTRGIVFHFIPVEFNLMDQAIADFEWLVKERPEAPVAHRFLADSYLKLNDRKRAREVLEEAVKRFPQDQKLRERLERLDAPQR
ncbi:MAG: ABC transporter permease [Acidobacteria bacterium]|nr:ABC transporter permease [Acidobacteriota bacterium]